jgi:hypothetical protein
MLALSTRSRAFSHFIAHFCISSHFIMHHHISLPITRDHLSMSNHLIGMLYSLPHGCNKHCSVITCYYVPSACFLPIPSMSDAICLVYSLMIALLLSPITPLYCTSLTIGFYSEVVVTIRAHFVLPMVIVIRLNKINQTLLSLALRIRRSDIYPPLYITPCSLHSIHAFPRQCAL